MFKFIVITLLFSLKIEAKVIKDIEIKNLYVNENYPIPLQEGTDLKKGINLNILMNGFYSISDKIDINYQVKQELNKQHTKGEIYKLYTNFKNELFYISFGKYSKSIGPSENSLILSRNAPPFLLLSLETKKPINLGGIWKFNFLHGWLNEKRIDTSNPRIIILQIDYSPAKLIKIGINRFSLYSGKGLPDLKIWEYLKMLMGAEENNSFSKYDTDGYLGYDITLNLEKYLNKFDKFKIYYQQIASDIKAPWQKEDKGKWYFPTIVKLMLNSYQTGLDIKKDNNIYNFEFTSINDLFYIHHYYWWEGYSYKGFSLGYPYGRYLFEFYFKHKILLENENYVQYKLGWIKQPSINNTRFNLNRKNNRYYLETEYSKNFKNNLVLTPYLKLEYSINHDDNIMPMQFNITDKNKLLIITGISTKVKF